jgi:hypothetical protein
MEGGLGNLLFQVAAGVKFAQVAGVECKLSKKFCIPNRHSTTDYFSSVFSKFPLWTQDYLIQKGILRLCEPPDFRNHPDYVDIIRKVNTEGQSNVVLYGYFQNHNFVPARFKHMITLPIVDSSRVKDTCFLHIRGGDYVNHWLHDVKLSEYYKASVAHMKSLGIVKFSVFTNDKSHALQQEFLKDIEYEFVDAPEIDSLVLMSECRAGITANSSFSWWGAYLNPSRPICMPSKWFNLDMDTSGYYFPGVAVINVA